MKRTGWVGMRWNGRLREEVREEMGEKHLDRKTEEDRAEEKVQKCAK